MLTRRDSLQRIAAQLFSGIFLHQRPSALIIANESALVFEDTAKRTNRNIRFFNNIRRFRWPVFPKECNDLISTSTFSLFVAMVSEPRNSIAKLLQQRFSRLL